MTNRLDGAICTACSGSGICVGCAGKGHVQQEGGNKECPQPRRERRVVAMGGCLMLREQWAVVAAMIEQYDGNARGAAMA